MYRRKWWVSIRSLKFQETGFCLLAKAKAPCFLVAMNFVTENMRKSCQILVSSSGSRTNQNPFPAVLIQASRQTKFCCCLATR